MTQGFTVSDGSNLELAWDVLPSRTTITFPADVAPSLGGTLTISLDPARVFPVGRTRQLFDWGQPLEPSNRFDRIEVPRGTQWDLSQLYTTGEVVLLGVTPFEPGDTDKDFDFDQADIVQVLQAAKYQSGQQALWREGDWDGDGVFDEDDIVAALQTGNYLQRHYAAMAVDRVFAVIEV